MRFRTISRPTKTADGEDDDPQARPGDRHLAEHERAGHPGRIADLAVLGAEDGADGLLQDQRDAPGGEQRLERPAVEEADHRPLDDDADAPGDEEGERQGDQQGRVEEARKRGADHLLHDEGGVGAEHHHLAMRHVDDAHDAEGDGKADGREQQDRSERKAVPEVLADVPERERAGYAWRRRRSPLRRPRPPRRCSRRAGPCASREPRSEMVSTAATLSASGRSEARTAAARAAIIAVFTRVTGSSAIAASRAGMAAASLDFITASAAARRTSGSSLRKVSVPTAAEMARRRRLLTLIFSTTAFLTMPPSAPVTGSVSWSSLPASLAMKTARSDLRTVSSPAPSGRGCRRPGRHRWRRGPGWLPRSRSYPPAPSALTRRVRSLSAIAVAAGRARRLDERPARSRREGSSSRVIVAPARAGS